MDENQKVTVAVRVRPRLERLNERYQLECVQKSNDGEDRTLTISQKQEYDTKVSMYQVYLCINSFINCIIIRHV
jgi:hypothetical protein